MLMEISPKEISDVIRLVLEVCDRWDDPQAWREHLLRGACGLLDAHVGSIFDVEMRSAASIGRVRAVANVGFPDAVRRAMLEASLNDASYRGVEEMSQQTLPGTDILIKRFAEQGWSTMIGRELANPTEFRNSPTYQNFRRPLNCDDLMVSMRTVDIPNRVEIIDIDRPLGSESFGEREKALLKFLHDEIAPLVGVRLATEKHLCRDGLSQRLNESLSLLMEGRSEKEIAQQLKLSPFTVHRYVAKLYSHFQVSSRPELLAYFIRRTPAPRGTQSPISRKSTR
jgi:DNA-binding CsgD family transcriptional regulator